MTIFQADEEHFIHATKERNKDDLESGEVAVWTIRKVTRKSRSGASGPTATTGEPRQTSTKVVALKGEVRDSMESDRSKRAQVQIDSASFGRLSFATSLLDLFVLSLFIWRLAMGTNAGHLCS